MWLHALVLLFIIIIIIIISRPIIIIAIIGNRHQTSDINVCFIIVIMIVGTICIFFLQKLAGR